MLIRGVRLPNFTQNLLKFPMKMKYLVPEGGSSEPLEPPLNPPLLYALASFYKLLLFFVGMGWGILA